MSVIKEELWWEVQKNGGWKILTNHLSRSAVVHKQFDSFIKIFYWRFRQKKGIPQGSYNPEINFQGFKEFSTNEQGTMGHCESDINIITNTINGEEVGEKIYNQKMSITLSQLYLLDKLDMDKFICSYSSKGYKTINISFDKLIETIAHELAHAYQNTINIKEKMQSQCESSGKRDIKGNLLYPQLASEHTRLTEEIKLMITNSSEYQNFKKWWVQKNSPQESDEELNDNHEIPSNEMKPCENCGKINHWNCCDKCAREGNNLDIFFSLIQNSKDLTNLENNYQSVKNDPYYNGNNKAIIDKFYNTTKNHLQAQTSQENHWWKDNKELIWFLATIGGIIIIWLIFFDQKKRKKRY